MLEAIDEAHVSGVKAREVELLEPTREPGGGYTLTQGTRYALATTPA